MALIFRAAEPREAGRRRRPSSAADCRWRAWPPGILLASDRRLVMAVRPLLPGSRISSEHCGNHL